MNSVVHRTEKHLNKTEFVRLSQKSHFSETDYRFWKSYKTSDWDQMLRRFGRRPLGYTLQSNLSQFCKRKFPPISHTSGLSAKIRYFNNMVFMRKNLFPKMSSKAFIGNSKALKTLKLSDWLFYLHSCTKIPIAPNGGFRALTFDPLWMFHF